MTPERVADALERYMVAVVHRQLHPTGSNQAGVLSARQTFVNELRILLAAGHETPRQQKKAKRLAHLNEAAKSQRQRERRTQQ